MNILKFKFTLISLFILIMGSMLVPGNVLEKIPSNSFTDFIQEQNFNLGLDLKGGTHLDYKVDLTKPNKLNSDANPDNDIDVESLIDGIQATIEKRVNSLGVSEPNIYSSKAGDEYHIIVELAGIKDIEKAKAIVGKTIQLEFKEYDEKAASENALIYKKLEDKESKGEKVNFANIKLKDVWKETALDGSFFKKAKVEFTQAGMAIVSIEFNEEGGKLFGKLSSENIGKQVAIFVGGTLISAPVINEAILGGSAQISGNFTIQSAVELKNDLNTGAIGAPIVLSGEHTVDASLGAESLQKSLVAGLAGLLILILYMIYQYRLLGLVASISLVAYALILLGILKTSGAIGIPIVLTLAGIAGIILSIGMAIDANILIFERMKEEKELGKSTLESVKIGFDRAWTSIKDSNISSLITCAILIWFGTSIIKGFAVNLAIGIVVSMLTAVTFTRGFLVLFLGKFKMSNTILFKNLNKK